MTGTRSAVDATRDAVRRVRGPEAGHDWDTLTSALSDRGVLHVAPGRERRSSAPASAGELFERLVTFPEPRLQQAAALLLLTHPEAAAEAQAAIERLAGVQRDRAMRRYVAAAAMQRMVRTRIDLQIGRRPDIPPRFIADLEFSPLDEEFGRDTLIELARQEEALYGYDAWGTYRALLDLFLPESRRSGWGRPCASAPTEPAR